jgi:sporulation protein YlmC with PRC-barrel domain
MRMRAKQIIGLPAVTQSGQQLGTVSDLEVDVENHAIVQYVVRRGRLLAAAELLVHQAQVVSVDETMLVVVDEFGEVSAAEHAAEQPVAAAADSPMAFRR